MSQWGLAGGLESGREHRVSELNAADKRRVHAEQVDMLYEGTGLLLAFNLLSGAVLALVQSLVLPATVVIGWYAILFAVSAARVVLKRFYSRRQSAAGPVFWERLFLIGVACSGMIWGASAVVLFPVGETGHQLFVGFMLAGMTAGAAAALAPRLPLFFAFALPALLPLALRSIMKLDYIHVAMGVMALVFLAGMSLAARRAAVTIHSALVFAYDNHRLREEVSERRQVESELRASEIRFRDYAEIAANWFWELDTSFRFSYVSPRFLRAVSLRHEEMIGRRPEEVFAQGEQQVTAWRAFEGRLRDDAGEQVFEFDWLRPDGERLTFGLTGRAVLDPAMPATRYRGVGRDLTEERRASRLVAHQANHDILTGLVNRREFMRRLEQAVEGSRAIGAVHTLCYLDLDKFKEVNDSVGHAAGDELLRQVTSRLLGRLRQRDTLSRLGGDEFGLLLELCPLDQAERLAENLRTLIKDLTFEWDERLFRIGVSIGVVAIGSGETGPIALARADRACYKAKDMGRNRIFIDTEPAPQSDARVLAKPSRRAEGDRDMLVLQPVHRLGSTGVGELVGFELRRSFGDGESNVDFSGLAQGREAAPGGAAAERVVLRRALRAFARFTAAPPDSFLLLPLSESALSDDTLLEHLARLFRDVHIKPSRICLLLSEQAVVSRLSQAKHLADGVRELGSGFGIDGFGGGVLVSGALLHLPVQYLRLHPALMDERDHGPLRSAQLRSVRELAAAAGAILVAGMVQDHQSLTELAGLGFDLCHGAAVARPYTLDLRDASAELVMEASRGVG